MKGPLIGEGRTAEVFAWGEARPFDRAELEAWRAILAIGRLTEHIPGEESYLRALIKRAFGD